MDFFLWCVWYFLSWPLLRIFLLLASVILHYFVLLNGFLFCLRPLDIGVSLKFWSQMGSEWISFYIHPDWFHQSQDVCDSSSILRTPWYQVVCFIHCSIPQRCSGTFNMMLFLFSGPCNPESYASFGIHQCNFQGSFLFPVPPLPLQRRICLLGWGRSLNLSFKKILGLDCFKVGSEKGLFDCEIPKDVSLMQIKDAGILCDMFLFCILPSL